MAGRANVRRYVVGRAPNTRGRGAAGNFFVCASRWQQTGWIVYPDADVAVRRLVMWVHDHALAKREIT